MGLRVEANCLVLHILQTRHSKIQLFIRKMRIHYLTWTNGFPISLVVLHWRGKKMRNWKVNISCSGSKRQFFTIIVIWECDTFENFALWTQHIPNLHQIFQPYKSNLSLQSVLGVHQDWELKIRLTALHDGHRR